MYNKFYVEKMFHDQVAFEEWVDKETGGGWRLKSIGSFGYMHPSLSESFVYDENVDARVSVPIKEDEDNFHAYQVVFEWDQTRAEKRVEVDKKNIKSGYY